MAFSGGLGSLLVAAVARKRCDLTCLSACVGDAPDAVAADRCVAFMDYPVVQVRLTDRDVIRLAQTIARGTPRLRNADVLDLVPVAAVRERAAPGPLLSGVGVDRESSARTAWLRLQDIETPLTALRTSSAGPTRADLGRCGERLGLVPAFARPPRRAPSKGSGVGDAIRRVAERSGKSLNSLLRGRDYHDELALRT